MECFPQDLLLREMCTNEASFHPELRSVSPEPALRGLVALVDRAGECLARFLGRLTETNLIKAGRVYVNHGDPGRHGGAEFHPPRSPLAALGRGVNAPWQIGEYAPYRLNGFSAYSIVHDKRRLQICAQRTPVWCPAAFKDYARRLQGTFAH